MPPKKGEKLKEKSKTPSNQSQSASTAGLKRSAEKEKTGENTKKRGREVKKEDQCAKGLTKAKQKSMTYFMDMPDDCIIPIFKLLDLPSRLNLRANKRLDGLYFAVKNNVDKIWIEFERTTSAHVRIDRRKVIRTRNFTEMEQILRRFAVNTAVDRVEINVDTVLNGDHCRIIDALFQFKAHEVQIVNYSGTPIILDHLPVSSFLTLLQNAREVEIHAERTALTAPDLCSIRKAILEGDCATKSFNLWLREVRLGRSFLKECFGVTIKHVSHPIPGKIYLSTDGSLEMYEEFGSHLFHKEGDLQTTVLHSTVISFKKVRAVNNPVGRCKLRLNHLYAD